MNSNLITVYYRFIDLHRDGKREDGILTGIRKKCYIYFTNLVNAFTSQTGGTGMITQKEIAKICNVSVATVSNVINGKAKASEETTKRILEAIEANGYRPNAVARGLRTKRTNMIAVIAEDVAQFTSPPVISSIMDACEKKGYRVVVYNLRLYDRWSDTWYDHENAYHSVLDPVLQNIRASGADGVIYLAGSKWEQIT